jgi:hypothetical protein
MPNVMANGIQIVYETFGKLPSQPLRLIIGLYGQLIFWDDGAERGRPRNGRKKPWGTLRTSPSTMRFKDHLSRCFQPLIPILSIHFSLISALFIL